MSETTSTATESGHVVAAAAEMSTECPGAGACAGAGTGGAGGAGAGAGAGVDGAGATAAARTPTRFNFGRVSALDELAHACSRPGYPSKAVTAAQVEEWVVYLRTHGVTRVVSLLGDDEVADWYTQDLDAVMDAAMTDYARTSVFADGAKAVLEAAFQRAHDACEAFVVHCSGGTGRASLGASVWLVWKHGLTPEQAAGAMLAYAKGKPFARRPSAQKNQELHERGCMSRK